MKSSINSFSQSTLDKIMAMPERLKEGEKIEDVSFDLTIGFQEIDRLSQEIDMINTVYNNIKKISLGQLPDSLETMDENIDKRSSQDDIDALINSL